MTTIKLRGGTAAQWAAANPVLAFREPGVETDTGKLKYGDGATAWAALSYSGSGQVVFNAADFGAVGDGVADDTTAIQNTIAAASAAAVWGSPVVRIPKGTHLVTGLTAASGVSIVGAHSAQSILKTKTGTASTKLLNLSGKTDVLIADLGFDGSSDTVCKSGVYANTTGTEKRIRVQRCSFRNFMPTDTTTTHAAVYVWTAQGVEVSDSYFSGCGRAITMDQPDGKVLIHGNHIIATTGVMATGIYLRRASGVTLAQATVSDNVVDGADYDPGGQGAEGHGIAVYRCRDVKIIGNSCFRSGRGVLVSYLSYGAIVSGNTAASNGDAGIRVEPDITTTDTTVGTAGVVRGCTVVGNVAHDNVGIGITLSYAASSVVANNVAHTNAEYGIHTDSDRTLVIGNTAYNNWQTHSPSHGTKSGFANYAGVGIVFIGNNAYDNQTVKTQDYGLSCTNSTFAPVLLGNNFTGNNLGEVDNPGYVTQGMDGLYNGRHLVLGANHLWIDNSGNLRLKSSAPTTATDGTSLMPASSSINMQVFSSSGTWTKPAGATTVEATVIAGGGGGGSGRQGAASSVRCGGGGGGAGGVSSRLFRASDLGATETVTVGGGGAGGAAVSTADTNGNPGVGGSSSGFGTGKVRASFGAAGLGGTNALGTGGAGGLGIITGGTGSSASTTGAANTASATSTGPTGGGSGGGIPTTNTPSAGGATGSLVTVDSSTSAGGVVDSTLPGTGTAGLPGQPGGGGGGGAGSVTTAAQAGATAGFGAGGGGGGASLNGANSGAGGAGGGGCVIVASW